MAGEQGPQDGLAGSVEARLPGRPNLVADPAPVGPTEGQRKSTTWAGRAVATFAALALVGTLGLGMCHAQAAEAAPAPPAQTQVVKHQNVQPKAYQAGKAVNHAGQQALKQGKKALETGKEVTAPLAQFGKDVGHAGANLGKGIAKEATSFWKGLTHHD